MTDKIKREARIIAVGAVGYLLFSLTTSLVWWQSILGFMIAAITVRIMTTMEGNNGR